MNYRDQDDELERMRARRSSSARIRRPAPARRRDEYEDNYYDDDYYEEEYPYEEDDVQDIPAEDEL